MLRSLVLMVALLLAVSPASAGTAAEEHSLASLARGPGAEGSQWCATVWVDKPSQRRSEVRVESAATEVAP